MINAAQEESVEKVAAAQDERAGHGATTFEAGRGVGSAIVFVAGPAPAAHQGTQSAGNTLNSPGSFAFRSDTQTRRLPSGENIGKLLKCPSVVTRSKPAPSSPMRYRWKLGRPPSPRVSTLDEKMMRLPS